jgi:hypothetical protein
VRGGVVANGAGRAPTLWLLALLFATGLTGAQAAPAPAQGFVRPSVAAVRIETKEAPTIDGNLSDPVWAKAAVIDKFTQKGPNPGEPATERTELRILYDENNLYFGVYNYDSQPDAIIARSMSRDGPVLSVAHCQKRKSVRNAA